MENLPRYISVLIGLTSILALAIFYRATPNSKSTLIILPVWFVFQTWVGLSGFYTHTDVFPPRFLLLILPPFLFIIGLFASKAGRAFLDSLDIKILTLLHGIRVPVEWVLYWLYVYNAVPQIMTFEGRNWDVLSGLSAPFVFYFGFINKRMNKKWMLLWNFICLGLLINIVVHAILSAPSPFQKFAFDQPNIALLYFPFNWLPSCVVPLVFLSHLVCIRQLFLHKAQ